MKQITLINAYGDKNIGDAVILEIAINFINEANNNNCHISVLCEDKKFFSNFISKAKNAIPFQLPYGHAISSQKGRLSNSTKIIRFFQIFWTSYFSIVNNIYINKKLPTTGLYSYIAEIKNADLIVGIGGGYITTNTKYTDYFGLLLTLLPIYIAKIYKKRIIILPISFGPFASDIQKKVAYHAITNTTVLARDHITLRELKVIDKNNKINKYYAPDLALFLTSKNSSNLQTKLKSKYVVLTAREWFVDEKKQLKYENSLTQLVDTIWKSYQLKTIFIPMARNSIEDDDNRVAKRIINHINDKGSIKIINPKSIDELQKILANARLAICTRMHSAILATTVHTPFIAIGYGHKMLGFVKNFHIEKWHTDIKDLHYDILLKKFKLLLINENYIDFIKKLDKKHTTIKNYKNIIINELTI